MEFFEVSKMLFEELMIEVTNFSDLPFLDSNQAGVLWECFSGLLS